MVIGIDASPYPLGVTNPGPPTRGLTLALQVKWFVSNVVMGSKERVLVNGRCELSMDMVTLS